MKRIMHDLPKIFLNTKKGNFLDNFYLQFENATISHKKTKPFVINGKHK